jgi:hypothetical protein
VPYFSPLERNSIIDYLVPRVALSLGKHYKGSVATFTGVRRPEQPVWIDNITTDYHLWYRSGNDLRTIGLWQYRIPTLFQANMAMTPQYFLTVAEFLSQPSDKQMWIFIGITEPNQSMLSLWGGRFVITDHPLSFGSLRVEMPVSLSDPPLYASPIRLYELDEPNLGNYSPTETISAKNASETLDRMGRSDFDGKLMVVTDGDLSGHFVPAREASMTLIEGGLLLKAESEGESLLVLPVQYSHCWAPASTAPIALFRANLMQMGVRFYGRLLSEIKFKFGPLWNSHCRRQDARDAQRLDVVGARKRALSRGRPALPSG